MGASLGPEEQLGPAGLAQSTFPLHFLVDPTGGEQLWRVIGKVQGPGTCSFPAVAPPFPWQLLFAWEHWDYRDAISAGEKV